MDGIRNDRLQSADRESEFSSSLSSRKALKMKQKIDLQFFTILSVSICTFAFTCCVESSICNAQGLQTSSANTTQLYGQWNHPTEQQTQSAPPADDPTKDKFRNLFPSVNLRPIADRSAAKYPLQPQKPSPMTELAPKARPLQPVSQNNFIPGKFSQEPSPGGDFVHVNHHEASTAEAVMPLPKSTPTWNNVAPTLNTQAEVENWPTTQRSDVTSQSSLSGIVGSIQSSSKELLGGFQSKGGWGEKIAALFGGPNNQSKKVFGSLALVIGGYLGFVWLMRKFNFSSNRGIPSEVIEVIGNAPFGPRKNLQLVRLGSKLLLLMNGPEGTHPVGEITDAEEVDHLISLCKGRRTKATSSVSSAVKQISDRVPQLRPTPRESTFSTSQLVQALESIQNSNRSNTVFEA
jgi:flagellar biogenesis protein FliO